jgi:glutamate synthase domain-containing protein 2
LLETGIYPDFITVDGKEGGTGAAPLEFSDSIGLALNEGLVFVRNAIVGIGLKDSIRIIASGKIITGFDMVSKMALGADICNSARGMMFALGCVQSRRCNKNTCPTGVTTQKPNRVYALNVDDKASRVRNFHDATIKSFLAVLGATGLSSVADLTPAYLYRRHNVDVVKRYDEIYSFLKPGQLLRGEDLDAAILDDWQRASADKFY